VLKNYRSPLGWGLVEQSGEVKTAMVNQKKLENSLSVGERWLNALTQ